MASKRKDLLSIKDFSAYTGVKQSVLRYYDELGLFKPAEKGDNQYRYYSVQQIQTIKLIETLRKLHMSLKEIEEVMSNRSAESMIRILSHHEVRLNRDLKSLQESFGVIHTLRSLMQSDIPDDINDVRVRFREGVSISMGPLNNFSDDDTSYHRVYSNYYKFAQEHKVNLSYPIGGYFDTFEEFLASPGRPKRFFSMDTMGNDEAPSGNYIVGYTRGDYGQVGDLPQRLEAYISSHELRPKGPVYHVYPLNETSLRDPNDYLQRVSIWLGH